MVIVSNTLIKGVGIFEKGEKMAFEGKGQIKKGIVVDTSAMMDRPNDILRLKASIFVPLTVIKQLDGLKNSPDPEWVALTFAQVRIPGFGSVAEWSIAPVLKCVVDCSLEAWQSGRLHRS